MQPGDFLPTFVIATYDAEITNIEFINDATLFDFYFVKYDRADSTLNERIEAIGCYDYINGPHWDGYSQAERDSALE